MPVPVSSTTAPAVAASSSNKTAAKQQTTTTNVAAGSISQPHHSNPNDPLPAMGSMRLGHSNNGHSHQHDNDAQVQVIAHDAPLPTLCDVVCESLLEGRDPVRPTISRLVIVGELPSKDDPPRVFFDDCLQTATKRVNASDPTAGKGSSIADPMNISGVFVELPSHFFQVLESEPAHLLAYTQELHARAVQKKFEGVNKVHIILYTDDIVHRSSNKMYYLELPPSAASGGQLQEDYVMEHVIVEQVHKVLQLLQNAHSQTKQPIDNFLSNAKTTQGALFPKIYFVEKCISCGFCLTLDEYVHVFAEPPNVVRAGEVLQPVEQPLPYALQ
ncbi:Hypothetical protein, putative [Bodo saltans]|uniref:Uncharacterized protein n=1 Tax=Bodo saltans TaxID=75058 RepID=A0A0S4JEV4_BODSA|nr:Hypothetical protein, putative [Bodo saltans]|eukprot:CUG88573.1 Hypothetical protein, putative [Bodo saltans]